MDLGVLDQHQSSEARPRVFCPFFSRQSALLIIPSRGSGNPETTPPFPFGGFEVHRPFPCLNPFILRPLFGKSGQAPSTPSFKVIDLELG